MTGARPNSFRLGPDATGHFGAYGGRFVAETLMPLMLTVEQRLRGGEGRPGVSGRTRRLAQALCRPPNPLYLAERLTAHLGGAKIYLKREDLNHTGAHKINNCLGQILLAKRMGKTRIIAETGAGQHGVATATVAALFRSALHHLHGRSGHRAAEAQRVSHASAGRRSSPGQFRLAHAERCDERGAARLGRQRPRHVLHHRLGRRSASLSDDGARFPDRDRQGDPRADAGARRAAARHADRLRRRRLQRHRACSIPFLDDTAVAIHGVEAAGEGVDTAHHAATLSKGTPGVLHGARSYLLQDADGQMLEAHSISAGLDYPGVGPEHSWLKDTGRVVYSSVTDDEALDAFQLTCRLEGIIPGAGIRARHRPCGAYRADLVEGQDHCHRSLRPRRQGCVHRRRRSR